MRDEPLLEQLERSQARGFLGPGPVDEHVAHAAGFLAAMEGLSGVVLDLGAGGGVPGLVIGRARPDLELLLLDSMGKRCRFLQEAVAALGLRATVIEGRAEVLGRTELRGSVDIVVARSFGPPATTAECGAPFLRVGGVLLVSEPPGDRDRWPADGLELLGLATDDRHGAGAGVKRIEQRQPCLDRFPRRDGVPAKRPLF